MASRKFLSFSSLLLFLLSSFQAPPTLAGGRPIEAIYSFGDSITDTGNLIRQGTGPAFSTIASLPYGQTAFDKPTGRCSDGLLMIDYLASALNLSLINPYLDKNADFNHGVNFAVAGATALDNSFLLERKILMPFTTNSLGVQLEWFKSHLNSTCSSQPDCVTKLEQSLIMMGEIGGNDYNYAFFQGKPVEEVMTYVPHVVERIINATKEVIATGAVHLVVPGNFPIGCMPSYLTAFRSTDPTAYDSNKCLKGLNSFAMFHNQRLKVALDELSQTYPRVHIMYADYYQSFMHLLDNASSLGFDEGSLFKACCGAESEYNFEFKKMCGNPGTTVCPNPAQRISWDGIHLTQEAYRIMAKLLTMAESTYLTSGVQKRQCNVQ